jgi:RNA polymerase sigma factor (sigma-70 family)
MNRNVIKRDQPGAASGATPKFQLGEGNRAHVMKATAELRTIPADPLELYMREARGHDLLSPQEEKDLLGKVVRARNAWLKAFLGTEPALRAVWEDLQRFHTGEIAALSLIPGPPRPADASAGPTLFATRLYRIFARHVGRHPNRPFRSRRSTARLVRAIIHVGFRPGPLSRYRNAAVGSAPTKAKDSIRRLRRRFLEVRTPLIERNLRLVMKVAHQFVPGPLSYAELIQEGNLGLIRSAESFSPRFGVRFSTYAYLWIRQSILRALENKSRTIRLPVSLTQALRKLDREAAEGEEPTNPGSNLTGALANPSVGRPILSLDHSLDEDTELAQIIADQRNPGPDVAPQARDSDSFVRQSLQNLPDRQRLILRLRFGIDGARSHTLTEIGDLLGVSAERIRQLQKQAFDSLREGPVGNLLQELVLD